MSCSSSSNCTYSDSHHLDAAMGVGSGYTAGFDASGNLICRAPKSATTCAVLMSGAQMSYDNEGRLDHWQNKPSSPTSTDDFLSDGAGSGCCNKRW